MGIVMLWISIIAGGVGAGAHTHVVKNWLPSSEPPSAGRLSFHAELARA